MATATPTSARTGGLCASSVFSTPEPFGPGCPAASAEPIRTARRPSEGETPSAAHVCRHRRAGPSARGCPAAPDDRPVALAALDGGILTAPTRAWNAPPGRHRKRRLAGRRALAEGGRCGRSRRPPPGPQAGPPRGGSAVVPAGAGRVRGVSSNSNGLSTVAGAAVITACLLAASDRDQPWGGGAGGRPGGAR